MDWLPPIQKCHQLLISPAPSNSLRANHKYMSSNQYSNKKIRIHTVLSKSLNFIISIWQQKSFYMCKNKSCVNKIFQLPLQWSLNTLWKLLAALDIEVQMKTQIMIAIIVNKLGSLPSLVISVILHISDSSVILFLFILTF